MKDIAIVILSWNGKKYLEDFLPALVKHSADARIIVADNSSTDNSLSFVRGNYPQIEIVQNSSNGGFAKGYNDALKKIESKYYLLINSDVEVSENWLEPLFLQIQEKEVAAVQPKIKSFHKPNYFEHAGAAGGFIDKNLFPFCRGRIFGNCEEDLGQYDGVSEVFWTSGACMLIKSSVFHELEGFDEDFFAHMEEIDLCWRMKKLNYKLIIEPKSVVYHVGGGTLNYESPNKIYLNFRNNLFMITKNYRGLLFLKLFYRMILDGIAAIQFLVKGKFSFFTAIIKAHVSFYASLSKMLKKRKKIQKQSKIYNQNGFYTGSILWAFYFKKIKKFSELNQRLFK